MFCRACHHDLGGLQAGSAAHSADGSSACAECGRPFDPSNPKTFATRQRSRLELILLRRIAPCVMLGLLLFFLLWYGWIPRPVSLFGLWAPVPESVRNPRGSTLWVWADSLYGPVSIRVGFSIAEGWVWKDRVRSVRVFDKQSGEPAWEVLWEPGDRSTDEGVWTMRVLRPVPQSFELLAGFRATRERILGIVVGEHDPSVMIEPYEASGSEADILSAYIRATGISVRPLRLEEDQLAFWVFDEQMDRLVQVDQAELDRRGIEPVDRTDPSLFGGLGGP